MSATRRRVVETRIDHKTLGVIFLNKVFLSGRLIRDAETRYTQKGLAWLQTSIAVERPTKNKEVDFFNLVAWDKLAEIMGKYLSKGSKIFLEGHLQFSQYEKDGKKLSSVKVIVDSFEFAEPKGKAAENSSDIADAPPPFDPDDTPF